jgi:phosphocarrier protein
MTEKKIIVTNRAGIHARPAALIVQTVKNYKCNVYISRENETIDAKSIMGVITLGASYGTELTISAEGADEVKAVQALAAVFRSNFEED